MSGFLATLIGKYREQVERYRNRPFLRAAMAACAYVSGSDGDVSLMQRVRMDRVLETLDALKVFDPHEGVNLFNEFVGALNESETHGQRLVMQAIDDEVTLEPDKAVVLVRICLAVSERPDGLPAAEQERIRQLCHRLGVPEQVCAVQGEAD